jgi:hypothetical protein
MTDTLTTFGELLMGSLFFSSCDTKREGPIHVKTGPTCSIDPYGQSYAHDPQCPVIPASAPVRPQQGRATC